MSARIPSSNHPTVLIIGAGFGGLKLARNLINKPYQVVLLDRHNYHQFQPLFYQVATAGLAPSAISFPIRKLFHGAKNVHFRVAEVSKVNPSNQTVETDIGTISYDELVIATGAGTNYFGNTSIENHSFGMKSTEESLAIRNHILECMEMALTEENEQKRKSLLNIAIVGAGPTGVELAGALCEMKRYILPKDYPEIDFSKMQIILIEAGNSVLSTMSEKSSKASYQFLKELGVTVRLKTMVSDYNGERILLKDGEFIEARTLIWAAGVSGIVLPGLEGFYERNRIKIDHNLALDGQKSIYAVGDIALMKTEEYPYGHPQVAQVAIQMADHLSSRLLNRKHSADTFRYKDLGSMATIGRSKAVADVARIHMNGFFAWLVWLFVHLMAILGVKNKLFIFIDWMFYYISFNQSLRLVIKQKKAPDNSEAA